MSIVNPVIKQLMLSDLFNVRTPGIHELLNEGQKILLAHGENHDDIIRIERMIKILHSSSVSIKSNIHLTSRFAYGGIGTIIHLNSIIGEYCMIGANVTLGGGNSRYKGRENKAPWLKSNIYVSVGSVILGQVQIGQYSIIGANSVVLEDVEEFSIVAGNPAKVITKITPENACMYRGMFINWKDKTDREFSRFVKDYYQNLSENTPNQNVIINHQVKPKIDTWLKKLINKCMNNNRNFTNEQACIIFQTKLTMMMEPFAKNHIQEHAKLILNNQMPVLYSSLILDVSSHIDWDLRCIEYGRNSAYMWHQSLYSVYVLCKYWHENNDAVLLDKALELFDSWCLWYSINKKGAYFDEHAVSNRLSVICYLNNILIGSTNNSFRDEHYSIFSELIHEHFVWLSDDKHYVNNNHGLIIDNAIIQASMKLKNVINVENVVNKSIKRIYQMFCDSFDEDGVNNENSPEYHMVNMNMYGFLNKFIQTYNLDFPESELLKTGLAKAIQVSSFMIRDDGCTPTIGDTYVKPYSYIQNKNGVVCYKTAKFGVIKADGFYFSIKCGGTSFHHKHIDETSITLRYNQTNIFVDGGSFSYDRKDIRSLDAVSYKSHSGFFTEDFKNFRFNDFTINDLKNKTCLDLLYNQQPKVGFIATNNLINDISITRKVHFFSQSDINIIDEGISESNRIWIQQFILHPDAKIIESQDNKLLFNIRGLNVDINVSGKCYLELEDTLYSEQFMQGITCKRVKFYFEGKSCLFNTNIKISLL